MAGVGEPARERPLAERLGDRVGDDHPAERHVAGVHALGERDQVGRDAPVVDREPLAAAAEAGHHLVGDEARCRTRRRSRARRRGSRAAAPGCRWCRPRSPGGSRRPCPGPRTRSCRAGAAARARTPAPRSSAWNGDRYGYGPQKCTTPTATGSLAQRRGSPVAVIAVGGRAVVAAVGGEHLVPAGVQPGHPDRVLVRLGAAVGEEHLVQVARRQLGDQPGRLAALVVGERRRDGAQRRRLLLDRGDQPRVLVADVDVHQLRGEVEVPVAGVVPEVAALRRRRSASGRSAPGPTRSGRRGAAVVGRGQLRYRRSAGRSSSSGLGEAEVDGGRGRVGPARGDDLACGCRSARRPGRTCGCRRTATPSSRRRSSRPPAPGSAR